MNVLTRYVGREFLKLVGLSMGALILVYLLFDFIDRAGNFLRRDPETIYIALYYVYKVPTIVFQLAPVSVLLACLLTLAIFSRNSEITAMKAGGVGVPRIVLPIVALSMLVAVVSFFINEYVVPSATQRMKYVQTVHIKKQEWKDKIRKTNLWYKSPGAMYNIDRFDPQLGRLEGVHILRFDDAFNLVERTDATHAQWTNNTWIAFHGYHRTFKDNALTGEESFTERRLAMPETPEELKVYKLDQEQMSFRELRKYIGELRREGYDVRRYVVDLHAKVSFSLISVIMAVLGVPWAIRSGRQGGVAFGIGLAVIIGVVYWIVLGFCLALGRSGALPAIVAAWGPHGLFGLIGLVGLLRVRS